MRRSPSASFGILRGLLLREGGSSLLHTRTGTVLGIPDRQVQVLRLQAALRFRVEHKDTQQTPTVYGYLILHLLYVVTHFDIAINW